MRFLLLLFLASLDMLPESAKVAIFSSMQLVNKICFNSYHFNSFLESNFILGKIFKTFLCKLFNFTKENYFDYFKVVLDQVIPVEKQKNVNDHHLVESFISFEKSDKLFGLIKKN